MTTELDDVDRRLVHRLAEELPLDLTVVAGEIGTTADDAHQRLMRLRGAGVVRECVAQIDPAAVGLGCTAFLLVRVAQNADNFASIRQILGDLEAVEEAHAVGGEFDWLLKVRTASLADLQEVVTGKLSLVPGFIRAQTCIVLDTACDFVNADRVRLAGR
jgi:Lrp/AsnC family transcriptional regulator, leucine-responsive regulatory protein